MRTKFRFRWKLMGGHVHVRLFAGKSETGGKCGDLVFREDEWEDFKDEVLGTSRHVEFIEET